ncbi:MAG: tRNA preQ1(34) S-adenosylmethionine ribosyltransferase-isomerase QueA [Clostridiales bacterium]|nr:tRNA preQ1(34) S-adenosylmethionine ribosyltransferase-isomerase QueA [Clostridiales bacterium]
MKDIFKKETYFYNLPEELIAQTPIEPRDHSRMLVFDRKTEKIEHKHFYDILNYFKSGDVIVVNNTRVIPARLIGNKADTNAKIEVFLLKKYEQNKYEVLLKPAKKAKIGSLIKFSDNLSCTILEKGEMGLGKVEFNVNGIFEEELDKVGLMPLPPYIREKLNDKERYQTIYSKTTGSSAAPTAGLHFTKELLNKLKEKGVIIVNVLLHVGLGTFRPVSADNILEHDMHSEYYEISQESADEINKAISENRRVFAVGTTSVRTLESSNEKLGDKYYVKAGKGNTNIFIYPGYEFKIVKGLITNFHLPESTLIMLVSAFCGLDNTLNFYNEAVKEKYRFFSFGDACLLI